MTKIYNHLKKGSTKADHPVSECEKWGCRGIAPRYEKPKESEWDEENHPESMCEEFGCKAISIWVDPR